MSSPVAEPLPRTSRARRVARKVKKGLARLIPGRGPAAEGPSASASVPEPHAHVHKSHFHLEGPLAPVIHTAHRSLSTGSKFPGVPHTPPARARTASSASSASRPAGHKRWFSFSTASSSWSRESVPGLSSSASTDSATSSDVPTELGVLSLHAAAEAIDRMHVGCKNEQLWDGSLGAFGLYPEVGGDDLGASLVVESPVLSEAAEYAALARAKALGEYQGELPEHVSVEGLAVIVESPEPLYEDILPTAAPADIPLPSPSLNEAEELLFVEPAEVPLPPDEESEWTQPSVDPLEVPLPLEDDEDLLKKLEPLSGGILPIVVPADISLPSPSLREAEELLFVEPAEVPLPLDEESEWTQDIPPVVPADIPLPSPSDDEADELRLVEPAAVPLPSDEESDWALDPLEVPLPLADEEEDLLETPEIPVQPLDLPTPAEEQNLVIIPPPHPEPSQSLTVSVHAHHPGLILPPFPHFQLSFHLTWWYRRPTALIL
ncbi:hypothetical protein FA95DRAFT_790659 [Auriscalpium vulgare]|uniref:Uncharacterized protein n=1 Tax=Auriscalpium vulgare TaxID=40419 RepID=A0ACB8RA48_9AGAM|nr:hypothetical protein FA95DRAFT_790659 [Auriscalpium vulgare]